MHPRAHVGDAFVEVGGGDVVAYQIRDDLDDLTRLLQNELDLIIASPDR